MFYYVKNKVDLVGMLMIQEKKWGGDEIENHMRSMPSQKAGGRIFSRKGLCRLRTRAEADRSWRRYRFSRSTAPIYQFTGSIHQQRSRTDSSRSLRQPLNRTGQRAGSLAYKDQSLEPFLISIILMEIFIKKFRTRRIF